MDLHLLEMLGYALLGGLILNIMPCVLPVLTFKVIHVVENAHAEPRTTRLHGLAYTGGIVATMLALGVFVVVLKASSEFVGWGMQFQNPAFVATLTTLLFLFGLNSVGVFELPMWLQGGGGGGYWGSFVNGVFASVMSTPCSAPALGTAAAFALDKSVSNGVTLLVFSFIGLGLASPFLVVSFVPGAARFLPKPGQWMNHVKHLMGFTLFAAAAWLYGALRAQTTSDGAQGFLYFLVLLALAMWALERLSMADRRPLGALVCVAIAALGFQLVDLDPPPPMRRVVAAAPVVAGADGKIQLPPVVVEDKIVWAPFDSGGVKRALSMQRPVFMDYTADWCLNCKTNEAAFIEVERIRQVLTDTQILPMKADMTNKAPEIEKWLDALGRNGIPVYVIYLPDGKFDLLPEVITTDLLAKRLQAAAVRFPTSGFKPPSSG